MDLYSRLNPSSKIGNTSYHLVQLTKDLLEELDSKKRQPATPTPTPTPTTAVPSEHDRLLRKYDVKASENYQFKSIDELATPYLTTPSATYKIRQQNHSNCVMLLHNNVNFLNFDNYLILERQNTHQLRQMKLSFKDVPIKELNSIADIKQLHSDNEDDHDCLTVQQLNKIYASSKKLLENTPISISEFDTLILQSGYVPHYNSLAKIHTNLETMILNLLLSCILEVAEDINAELLPAQAADVLRRTYFKILEKFRLEKNHLILRIVTNVFLRYVQPSSNAAAVAELPPLDEADQYVAYSLTATGGYLLLHNKIIKFLTMTILEKEKTILLDDLLIQIRLNLPVNYLPSFEISEILSGFSYTQKLDNGQLEIHHLTVDQLSVYKTPQERFSRLFGLKSQWTLEELQPFVAPLNAKGIKIDKFCLKYCRVKKTKNRTVLMRR